MKSCKALLNWIGDLSLVPRSNKYDRLSREFTPTCFIVSLHKDQVKVLDDIKSKCKKFCFTDGMHSRRNINNQLCVNFLHSMDWSCSLFFPTSCIRRWQPPATRCTCYYLLSPTSLIRRIIICTVSWEKEAYWIWDTNIPCMIALSSLQTLYLVRPAFFFRNVLAFPELDYYR